VGATVRCPCGQKFWVGDDELGRQVPCPNCKRNVHAVEPPPPPPAAPAPLPAPACESCGAPKADRLITRRAVSFIVFTSSRIHTAVLCRPCATRACLRDIFITSLCGWWGVPFGPFLAFQAILFNIRALTRVAPLGPSAGLIAGVFVAALPFVFLMLVVSEALQSQPPPASPRDGLTDMFAARGRERLDARDYRAAAQAFDALLARSPDNTEARALLAQARAGMGHYRRAVEAYTAAVAMRPNDLAFKRGLARVLVAAGRPADARAYDQSPEITAHSLTPQQVVALAGGVPRVSAELALLIADAHLALGRADAARAWARGLDDNPPADADWPLARALMHAKIARSVAPLADAYARQPDPRLAELAAWLSLDRGDLPEARRWGDLAGGTTSVLMRVFTWRLAGRMEDARAAASKWVDALDPEDERAPTPRTILEYAAGVRTEAEVRALDDPLAALAAGSAHLWAGDPDRAREIFESAAGCGRDRLLRDLLFRLLGRRPPDARP